ncbi:MAG: hypothetical protein GXO82_09395 [Chlorobi bacterium]|nr:hypothetical protein [Chlorobiota bacterium]
MTLLKLFPCPTRAQNEATSFDVIAASFYFLSLYEESVTTERDAFDRFPHNVGLLGRREEWDRPVVAEYAFYLKHRLESKGRNVPMEDRFAGRPFAVALTHDVDYLRKWTIGIAYREIVRMFLINDPNCGFEARLNRLRDFLKAVYPSQDPYRNSLNLQLEIEKRFGVTATYFLKTGKSNKRDRYYKPSDPFLTKWRQQALDAGMELGFHPSFETYLDTGMWEREKAVFIREYGMMPASSRQHYLRYSHPGTLHILERAGIKYDSTLGHAAREGYRNGMVHPFLLFDFDANRVSPVWEVPLHVMDGTFVSYRKYNPETSLLRIRHFIGQASRWHGALTLLFHNVCADKWDYPGWTDIFEDSIRTALERGAFVGSVRDVVSAWIPAPYHESSDILVKEIG